MTPVVPQPGSQIIPSEPHEQIVPEGQRTVSSLEWKELKILIARWRQRLIRKHIT